MEKRAAELEAEVAKWLSAAEAADAEEDKLHGHDQTGEEMPDWVADKKRRAEKIRNAKAELDQKSVSVLLRCVDDETNDRRLHVDRHPRLAPRRPAARWTMLPAYFDLELAADGRDSGSRQS